jgi:NAD+ synthase (glutamine-hydrolysing)
LKSGGCYLYNNLRGCDGQRIYFNGCSCISINGQMVARTAQYGIAEVELAAAVIDLEDIRSYRNRVRSRSLRGAAAHRYPRVDVPLALSVREEDCLTATPPFDWVYHTPEEEISLGPACWLWDYLRRSGQGGYFLPLSGGVDSASSAVLVHSMCRLVVSAVQQAGDETALADVRRVTGDAAYTPTDAAELCNRLLVTCYMGSENSSEETKARAKKLAAQIGAYHLAIGIDVAVKAVLGIFSTVTGFFPKFRARGGSARENLALQNVQARLRMVLAYLFAQLMLWVRERPGGLLVSHRQLLDKKKKGRTKTIYCFDQNNNIFKKITCVK